MQNFWDIADRLPGISKNASKLGYKPLDFADLAASPGIFANWPKDFRRNISYQFLDLIVTCSFAGSDEKCDESQFKLFEHSEMFNCFTFQANPTENIRGGPDNGLSMLLYIGM